MDATDTVFQAPVVLRLLCYCAGMGVFLAEITWLGRLAFGFGNTMKLKYMVIAWFIRILAVCAFFSLLAMIEAWREISSPVVMLPELSILLLVMALWLITRKRPAAGWKEVFTRLLPFEVLKAVAVTALTLAGWALSFALGWVVFQVVRVLGGGMMESIFMIGLLWNAPLVLFYLQGVKKKRVGKLKFHDILWPVLLAYLLLLLPDYTEHMVNSPKMQNLLHAKPSLQRL